MGKSSVNVEKNSGKTNLTAAVIYTHPWKIIKRIEQVTKKGQKKGKQGL